MERWRCWEKYYRDGIELNYKRVNLCAMRYRKILKVRRHYCFATPLRYWSHGAVTGFIARGSVSKAYKRHAPKPRYKERSLVIFQAKLSGSPEGYAGPKLGDQSSFSTGHIIWEGGKCGKVGLKASFHGSVQWPCHQNTVISREHKTRNGFEHHLNGIF